MDGTGYRDLDEGVDARGQEGTRTGMAFRWAGMKTPRCRLEETHEPGVETIVQTIEMEVWMDGSRMDGCGTDRNDENKHGKEIHVA